MWDIFTLQNAFKGKENSSLGKMNTLTMLIVISFMLIRKNTGLLIIFVSNEVVRHFVN